jgi:hypothetical protein
MGSAAWALSPKMRATTKLVTIISVVLSMQSFLIFVLLFGFYENPVANSTIQKISGFIFFSHLLPFWLAVLPITV